MEKTTSLKREVISLLIHGENITISAIAEQLGCTAPTVIKYVNELGEAGLIERTGKLASAHGRKASVYAIRNDAAYFVGVTPRQNELTLAMMDYSGNVVMSKHIPGAPENTAESLELICANVDTFIRESGIPADKVKRICFGLSGRVNKSTGESFSWFNIENHDEPLADWLTARLGIPSIIDNDTRCMAYGELTCAIKDRFKNFLFVNAGWGIGLSIITNGEIYYGMNGYCGEIGHTNVYNNEIICHCGKKGCLETEVSGRALCHQLKALVGKGHSSILSSRINANEDITELDIIEAAHNDDQLCIELIERVGTELGRQIANLINIFNPEALILGGTLSSAGDIFVESVKIAARRYCLRLLYKDVKIIVSSLGKEGGILGCCLVARESHLSSL